MRTIALADLHYNISRCRQQVQAQAREVCRRGADVLVIAGDTASTDIRFFEEALQLFESFPGRKMLVPGNHDIWVLAAECSRKRYEHDLPGICRRHGFEYLDDGPVRVDGTAFVGTIGWYDYSFRDESLGVPMRFYEAKVGPGAADQLRRHRHLLNGHSDVTEDMKRITAIWRDGQHVKLGMSDVDFTRRQADKLRQHLSWAARRAEQIVAVVHHLPLREMAPDNHEPNWRFARAFLGSECFHEVLAGQPKVRYVLAGHSHWPYRTRRPSAGNGAIEYINIGSGYHRKHEVELEL